jgi:hypothetical protein
MLLGRKELSGLEDKALRVGKKSKKGVKSVRVAPYTLYGKRMCEGQKLT